MKNTHVRDSRVYTCQDVWLISCYMFPVFVSTGLFLVSLLLFCLCFEPATMFDSKLNLHWELWKKTHEKQYQNEVHDTKKSINMYDFTNNLYSI